MSSQYNPVITGSPSNQLEFSLVKAQGGVPENTFTFRVTNRGAKDFEGAIHVDLKINGRPRIRYIRMHMEGLGEKPRSTSDVGEIEANQYTEFSISAPFAPDEFDFEAGPLP